MSIFELFAKGASEVQTLEFQRTEYNPCIRKYKTTSHSVSVSVFVRLIRKSRWVSQDFCQSSSFVNFCVNEIKEFASLIWPGKESYDFVPLILKTAYSDVKAPIRHI